MMQSRIIIVTILVALCGCTSTPDKGVVDFIEEAKKQTPGYVENVIVVTKPEIVKYSAGDYRDPFESAGTIRIAAAQRNKRYINGPDANRRREPLENFPLDLLRMVGSIEREGMFFALIRDSNNVVHLASIGNHLGENSGEIEKITEQEIEVREWLPNGKGGWQKHFVSMPLLGAPATVESKGRLKK